MGERARHERSLGFDTRAVHAGQEPDPTTGAVVTPISLSTTFAQDGVGGHRGLRVLPLGQPDAHRARGVRRVARVGAPRARVRQRARRRGQRAAPRRARAAGRARQRRLRRHVPADRPGVGPARAVVDRRRPHRRRRSVELARRHGDGVAGDADQPAAHVHRHRGGRATSPTTAARSSSSTTRSPRRTCSSRSTLGADIVVHSATKYLGGHSDVVGGFVAVDDDELADRLRFTQNAAGAVPAPFDCYLVLRGVKTLAVRMERHCANARAVVDLLVAPPGRRAGAVPAAPRPPGPRRGGPADARLRRDGQLPARAVAPRRRSGSPRRPSCSRSPSRSARSRA